MGARAATLAAEARLPPRHGAALALVLAHSVLGCATAAPPAPGDPELRSFRIEGNASVQNEVIDAHIVTEERSWVPFSDRRYYDEAILETDLARILRLYQAEGFYQARIVDRTVTPSGEGRVDLTLRIDEGPATLLERVTVEGLAGLPEEVRAPLLEGCPLHTGEVFKEGPFESYKLLLAAQLAEEGYAEASVAGRARVDLATRLAVVTIEARPGRRYRLGAISVEGAVEIPAERIGSEARVALPEGEFYSPSALAAAQRRVFDLGVFSTVGVSRGGPEGDSDLLPLVVSVREAPFRGLRLGAGLGLDPRFTELPRVNAEWTHRNFLGGLRRMSLLGEVSLVYLPSLWVVFSGTSPTLDVAFHTGVRLEQPDVIGRDTALTVSLSVQRGVDAAFSTLEGRGKVGLVYRHGRRFEFAPSYHFSVFRLFGAAASAVTAGSGEAALDACAAAGQVCRLAYLEQRASYDLRDSAIEPRQGVYLALSLQEGSRYLGGGYDYLRLQSEVRAYLPIGPVVVAARVQAGILGTLDGEGSSVLTRFFLGGGTSERGFGNQQLAPALVACRYRDPVTQACQSALQAGRGRDTDVTAVLPVGGNGMLGANLEVRIPLPASFGLVVFTDVGEVTPELTDLRLEGLHVAVGLGVRYRTVLGPVRLDAAYRVNDPSLDYTFATDLPAGASPAPISRFAVHFSIGEAF